MTLTRWNPIHDAMAWADEMSRMLNGLAPGSARDVSLVKGAWMPAVDIVEDGDNFYLYADMPGLSKDQVKISYEDGILTLRGEIPAREEKQDVIRHRLERPAGKFERSFHVPSPIVVDKIEARFHDGLLTITLPKTEEVKPKQIEVKVS